MNTNLKEIGGLPGESTPTEHSQSAKTVSGQGARTAEVSPTAEKALVMLDSACSPQGGATHSPGTATCVTDPVSSPCG